jgi:hypothetical protein
MEAARRGLEHVTLGFAENHPLLNPLERRFRHLKYRSQLYLVHWDAQDPPIVPFDNRPVHVEPATL